MRNYRHLQGRTNPPLVKKKLGNEFESPVSAKSCAEPWEERRTTAKITVVSGATVVLRLNTRSSNVQDSKLGDGA